MDLLPEMREALVVQPGYIKPLPKNATKKQKRRANGFLDKMASMRAAKLRKAEESRTTGGGSDDSSNSGEEDMNSNMNVKFSDRDDDVDVLPLSATNAKAWAACADWLKKSGAKGLDRVMFAETTTSSSSTSMGGFGCFAKRDFSVGDTIFEIPGSCVFGMDQVTSDVGDEKKKNKSSSKGSKKSSTSSSSSSNDRMELIAARVRDTATRLNKPDLCSHELLLWLGMIEANTNPKSGFHSYMRSLDQHTTPSVMHWPPALKSVLGKVGPSGNRLVPDVEALLDDHLDLLEKARELYSVRDQERSGQGDEEEDWLPAEVFNRTSLIWAYGHYKSRRIPITLPEQDSDSISKVSKLAAKNGGGQCGVLVPALNVMNHGPAGTQWTQLERTASNGYKLVCTTQRKAGEEIYASAYTAADGPDAKFSGAASNEALLYHYGYARSNNEDDEVTIHLVVGTPGDVTDHGYSCIRQGGIKGVHPKVWRVFRSLNDRVDNDGYTSVSSMSGHSTSANEYEEGNYGYSPTGAPDTDVANAASRFDVATVAAAVAASGNSANVRGDFEPFEMIMLREYSTRLIKQLDGVDSDPELHRTLQSHAIASDPRVTWIRHYVRGQRQILAELVHDLSNALYEVDRLDHEFSSDFEEG
jgi:hypothetical protein